jgi:hypothetical protein
MKNNLQYVKVTNLKTNNIFTLKPVKKIIIRILMAFVLILISFVFSKGHVEARYYEDKLIISMYGKQMMYAESISKDASLIYTILLNNEVDRDDIYILAITYDL